MSPHALEEGHSSVLPPRGMMKFRVRGQCSNRGGAGSCEDRIRDKQCKLWGLGEFWQVSLEEVAGSKPGLEGYGGVQSSQEEGIA